VTYQDVLLVAGLAGLALAITLVDLTLSLMRHWRRSTRARKLRQEKGGLLHEDPAGAARLGRRLLDIEAASEGSTFLSPLEGGQR
jgi:hypothetical protein